MSIARRTLIPLCAALATATLAGLPAAAQNVTLRFNHVLGATEPYHLGFQ